jgi:hypothetical protein
MKSAERVALNGIYITYTQSLVRLICHWVHRVFSGRPLAPAGAETRFSYGAREAVVVEGDIASHWEEELRLLRDEIQSVADQLRYVTGSPNDW